MHGKKKSGTHPTHGKKLWRPKLFLSAGVGRGVAKKTYAFDRILGDPAGVAPHLPFSEPAKNSLRAAGRHQRSTAVAALALGPRIGHGYTDVSHKGIGRVLVKTSKPSKQCKVATDYSKPRTP